MNSLFLFLLYVYLSFCWSDTAESCNLPNPNPKSSSGWTVDVGLCWSNCEVPADFTSMLLPSLIALHNTHMHSHTTRAFHHLFTFVIQHNKNFVFFPYSPLFHKCFIENNYCHYIRNILPIGGLRIYSTESPSLGFSLYKQMSVIKCYSIVKDINFIT